MYVLANAQGTVASSFSQTLGDRSGKPPPLWLAGPVGFLVLEVHGKPAKPHSVQVTCGVWPHPS